MKISPRIVIRILLLLIIVVYAVDWTMLRVKIAHGTGYSTVEVKHFLSTDLKGNKAEYDFLGSSPQVCERSLLPHGATPCWWLARHGSKWE
jgi:hypothetical protein